LYFIVLRRRYLWNKKKKEGKEAGKGIYAILARRESIDLFMDLCLEVKEMICAHKLWRFCLCRTENG
jgi:hypothetical protein